MLATKHNSCLYLSQSLSLSLCLYIHCSKKSMINREIHWVSNWRSHIYTNCAHTGPYIQYCVSEKVSLFDFM